MFQEKWTYNLLKSYISQDLEKEFDGKIHNYSKRSASIVINSLKRLNRLRKDWKKLQDEIRRILLEKRSQAPLIYKNNCLHTKIIFESKILKPTNKSSIEFHKQYKYNSLDDTRCMKINSNYENIRKLRRDFISMSINHTVIDNRNNFLEVFNNEIRNNLI